MLETIKANQTPSFEFISEKRHSTPVVFDEKNLAAFGGNAIPALRQGQTLLFAKTQTLSKLDLDAFIDDSLAVELDEPVYITANPAEDLVRWLPGLRARQIAEMCGCKKRRFLDWLDGDGMSDKSARQLLQVRGLLYPVVKKLGPRQTTEWLQTALGDSPAPIALLEQGDIQTVSRMVGRLSPPAVVRRFDGRVSPVAEDSYLDSIGDSEVEVTVEDLV